MNEHVGQYCTIKPVDLTKRKAEIAVPSDKSLTHRAIFFAGAANGTSFIKHPSRGDDCGASRRAMEALGVKFVDNSDQWEITSPGIDAWGTQPDCIIDAANSGTTARLLLGLTAPISNLHFTIHGDSSLSKRPMARVIKPLSELGLQFEFLTPSPTLPLRVLGKKVEERLRVVKSNIKSAQIKSALLLSAMSCPGETQINVPAGTRDHTERMMISLGCPLSQASKHDSEIFTLNGLWRPQPFTAEVPGDPSALAFFAALACLHPGLEISAKGVLANPGRLHVLNLLQRMGMHVSLQSSRVRDLFPGEGTCDVTLSCSNVLKPLVLGKNEVSLVIDEIPALAVACTVVQGTSTFYGLEELKVKESNRLAEIAKILQLAGVPHQTRDCDLAISGTGKINHFSYESDDHRMVMASAILATKAKGESIIGDKKAVAVSFPFFFSVLKGI